MPFPGIQLIYLVAALLIVGVILWGLQQIPGIDPSNSRLCACRHHCRARDLADLLCGRHLDRIASAAT